ncbi:MAG TPA: rhodanese-like domain-containing protein, partial [Ktedonobacteraceae bacterium]
MAFRHLFHQSSVTEIPPQEAQRRQREGAVIVDVREPDEWNEGHILGALHIPLGSLSMRLSELDASQEIIMVCHSGLRSMRAAQLLQRSGFAQVKNLTGGM